MILLCSPVSMGLPCSMHAWNEWPMLGEGIWQGFLSLLNPGTRDGTPRHQVIKMFFWPRRTAIIQSWTHWRCITLDCWDSKPCCSKAVPNLVVILDTVLCPLMFRSFTCWIAEENDKSFISIKRCPSQGHAFIVQHAVHYRRQDGWHRAPGIHLQWLTLTVMMVFTDSNACINRFQNRKETPNSFWNATCTSLIYGVGWQYISKSNRWWLCW